LKLVSGSKLRNCLFYLERTGISIGIDVDMNSFLLYENGDWDKQQKPGDCQASYTGKKL
jgi:hypothetical protein